MTDDDVAICSTCNGDGTLRVGDGYECETFECGACAGTGLARQAGTETR